MADSQAQKANRPQTRENTQPADTSSKKKGKNDFCS